MREIKYSPYCSDTYTAVLLISDRHDDDLWAAKLEMFKGERRPELKVWKFLYEDRYKQYPPTAAELCEMHKMLKERLDESPA